MVSLISNNQDAIVRLCRKHGVSRLEVFGSAVEGNFDETRSDVDFLIEFPPGQDLGPWLSRYFDFKDALERLLGCRVDLVMPSAMKNPFFIREVNATRRVVYAS